MKKYKKVGITFIILSMLIIAIGIIVAVLVNKEKTIQENIVIVKDTYTSFSIDVVENYQIRSELKEKIDQFNNETYSSEHETYISLLNQYNENMTTLKNNVSILEDKCSIEYENTQTNIFCDNYQQLYEAINNVYIGMLTDYNNKITNYNETSEEDYELFSLINKDYVDFNNDGAYDGKTVE